MGKKGGGGGGQTPQVNVPAGLFSSAASETGLGDYATSLLNSLGGMTNWASSLATGGQAGGTVPSYQSTATQAGPQASWGGGSGGSDLWNTQFNPQTGLVTFTNPRDANQTFTENIMGSGTRGSWGGIDQSIINQWRQDYQANLANNQQGSGQATWDSVAKQLGLSQSDVTEFAKAGKSPQDVLQMYGLGSATAPSTSGQTLQQQMGPILGQAYNQIQSQVGDESQTQNFIDTTTSQANQDIAEGQSMLTQATTGSGLFPSQQAMIDLARTSARTELASTLGGMGLGTSTQSALLGGEIDTTAAAAGGSLVQGNISAAQNQIALGQASQKLILGGEALLAGEKQAVAQELQGLQKQFWDQAMQGYGMMGAIIDEASKSYGYSLSAYNDILGAAETQAGIEAKAQQDQLAADSQSSSAITSALGSLFGASGSSGGGILGSLFSGAGTASASAVGGAAASAVGGTAAAAGGGSAIGGILSALGALFCWVARACYGEDNPKWLMFREWMLWRSPDWLFILYCRHGEKFAGWLSDKPTMKFVIRQFMNAILYVDAPRGTDKERGLPQYTWRRCAFQAVRDYPDR